MLPHPAIIQDDGEPREGVLLRYSTNTVLVDGVVFPQQVGIMYMPDTNKYEVILLECIEMMDPERFLTKINSIDGLVDNKK